MTDVLGNHIILALILEHLPVSSDIVSLSLADTNIRSTLLSILPHSHILKLSFVRRERLKTKHLTSGMFSILSFRHLQSLNLSGSGVTSAIIRTLLFQSKTLKVLQIVECLKIRVDSLITLFRSIVKLRHGKRELPKTDFAPLVCLDCWGINGLSLDYKYQGKKEWMYESFCSDNKNLQLLSEETDLLGIDLNIRFCPSLEHSSNDIRYRPAARYLYGLSQCELIARKHENSQIVYCETCVLRVHNGDRNRRHKCRTLEAINLDLL